MIFRATLISLFLALPVQATLAQPPGMGADPRDLTTQAREPFKLFDNLYFVGTEFVCSYVLSTSEGLIIIDALFGDEGFPDYLLGNVRKLGFDPADIQYVLITHGHPDHYGGAAALQSRTGAIIGAAEKDWELIERDQGRAAPSRGLVIEQDDTLTLGETTIRFDITPGHTPGVISLEFDVIDNGTPYKAYFHGGSAPRTEDPAQIQRFIADLEMIKNIEGIEVQLANHPFIDDLFERAEALSHRRPGDPHPFVAPEAFYAWIDEVIAETRETYGGEANVRPGVNEPFLDPELDTETLAEGFESDRREVFVRRHDVIDALKLESGMAVADIGAGSGFFMELMAEEVGSTGRVYAVEIAPNWVEYLTEKAKDDGLEQVTVVLGGEKSVRLPAGSIDLAFASDTYHHFEYPQSSLQSIFEALRPGGRWVVVDYDKIPGVTPPPLMEHLRIGKAEAIEEILAAGFVLEEQIDLGFKDNYMVVFRRP